MLENPNAIANFIAILVGLAVAVVGLIIVLMTIRGGNMGKAITAVFITLIGVGLAASSYASVSGWGTSLLDLILGNSGGGGAA